MFTLDDKRLLLTGIATTESIAFAVARRAQEDGARLVVTAFPRDIESTQDAVRHLPEPVEVIPLDATDADDLARVRSHVVAELGGLDGALHAIAFSPRDALASLRGASASSVELAFRTSVFTYVSLGSLLAEVAPPGGGALVGLDFDAARAWPVYNWMGVCKAALGAANRYLARDLGPLGIRANLVAAGPLQTRAAKGIPDFDALLDAWDRQAPLAWDDHDPTPAADTVCFLLSDAARSITGEIVHVDGGYHAMATALRPGRSSTPAHDRPTAGTPDG